MENLHVNNGAQYMDLKFNILITKFYNKKFTVVCRISIFTKRNVYKGFRFYIEK